MNSAFLSDTNMQVAWDSTSLGALKLCPRFYYYSIVCGYVPHETSIHLTFGIVYHSALERYDHAKVGGADHEEAVRVAVHHALTATWDSTLQRPWFSDDDEKNRLTLVRSIVWYLDKFSDDPIRTVILDNGKPALELSFQFQLTPKFSLCGHLDRVGTLGDDTFICDRKTTGQTLSSDYFDQFTPDNQMSLYALASQIVYNLPIKGIIIDAVQVAATFSRYLRGFVHRTEGNLAEWLKDLHYWLSQAERHAETNHWPMNDKACYRCNYRSICSKAPIVREQWLKAGFKHRIWDPLRVRGDI